MEFAFNRHFRLMTPTRTRGGVFFLKISDALNELHAIATEAGASDQVAEAEELGRRVAGGRLHVACVGEFKRGKSTLINTMLGVPLLPTGVLPVTSIPTIVSYGSPGARIRCNGRWRSIDVSDVGEYVTQDRNPGNRRAVSGVEVSAPVPLLAGGLCLVDTPGLGSVFEANTASATDFLPHIDAAIVVLGADPPISGDELHFVRRLAADVRELFIVLNKMDRISRDARNAVVPFTRDVLQQTLARDPGRIYQVNALAGAADTEMARDWTDLVATLERLTRTSAGELLQAAVERGVRRIRTQLTMLVTEERRALVAPLEDSGRRLAELRDLAAGASRTRVELGPLLASEEARLVGLFAKWRREFWERTVEGADRELANRFERTMTRVEALHLANDIARATLEPWLMEAEGEADRAYRTAMSRFEDLAVSFVARLADQGVLESTGPIVADSSQADVLAPRGFYFTDLRSQRESALPWMRALAGLRVPLLGRWRYAAARRYLLHLLATNTERVENDLRDRLRQTREALQANLERLLAAAAASAARAVERGQSAQRAGAAAIAPVLARCDRLLTRLARL